MRMGLDRSRRLPAASCGRSRTACTGLKKGPAGPRYSQPPPNPRMATPHVSGTGALLRSRGFTAAQAWTQMTGTATDLGFPGFDLYYGWGRVDALAAVTKAPFFPPLGDVTPPTVAFTSPLDGYVID